MNIHNSAMPLAIAPANKCVTMQSVIADQKTQARMAAMGLYPGAELMVISRSLNGPCIVIVKDSRLILDMWTAHRIMVE